MARPALMYDAYTELIFGLFAAIVLVYLLIVVNFQSWLDPFIIVTALPGALGGDDDEGIEPGWKLTTISR